MSRCAPWPWLGWGPAYSVQRTPIGRWGGGGNNWDETKIRNCKMGGWNKWNKTKLRNWKCQKKRQSQHRILLVFLAKHLIGDFSEYLRRSVFFCRGHSIHRWESGYGVCCIRSAPAGKLLWLQCTASKRRLGRHVPKGQLVDHNPPPEWVPARMRRVIPAYYYH